MGVCPALCSGAQAGITLYALGRCLGYLEMVSWG